ncbi:MAG: hypothetical protein L3K07_00705 [Thermoplasmata archaeon]|nr:hypothetical protein [Thermoplasmata archaeon]
MEGRTASVRNRIADSREPGGRGAPHVRTARAESFWRELVPGLLAGWPLLLVGVLSLVLGILLYVRAIRLFPSSPLPVWVLFLGIGIIALAGAAIGAITPEEEPPVPRTKRTAPVPVAPREPAPRAAAPVDETELDDLDALEADPWDEEHEPLVPIDLSAQAAIFSLPVPRPVTPYSGQLGPDGLPLDPPEQETGEVLAQLEQLTSLLRPVRTYRPSSGGTAIVRYCIGCERRLPEEEELQSCTACHAALCKDCASASVRSGVGGKCPTCATLEEADSDPLSPSSRR